MLKDVYSECRFPTLHLFCLIFNFFVTITCLNLALKNYIIDKLHYVFQGFLAYGLSNGVDCLPDCVGCGDGCYRVNKYTLHKVSKHLVVMFSFLLNVTVHF